ncbi:MAG: cation:proton antiporter [Anaerolineae bacterium]|nr:cation:proton antiporter [Anaerolineae bacterium]
MSDAANLALQFALYVMILLMLPAAYRVFRGINHAERLQGIDLITTLLIGIIVLLALVLNSSFVVDIGIALAAFSFVGTVAIARYLSEGRVF